MSTDSFSQKQNCTLLLFVATSTEEDALRAAAESRNITFEKVSNSPLKQYGWGEYHWLGAVGYETVIAVRPTREQGDVVMGAHGRLGVAAKAIRFQEATGANGIIQLGMAFGVDRQVQKLGDVLVSTSLVPYDNRIVNGGDTGYATDYSPASREPARLELVNFFRRQHTRSQHSFGVHLGAMLSGAARIHSQVYRDELVEGVPLGEDPIVGGEMEGVGLLAASTTAGNQIWCVVKGISDFADELRDEEITDARPLACRNAADFVLSALLNDLTT